MRLSCDRKTWPIERGRQLAVDASSAKRLYAMLRAGGDENRRAFRTLRREAELRFAHALGEYTLARRGRPLRVP